MTREGFENATAMLSTFEKDFNRLDKVKNRVLEEVSRLTYNEDSQAMRRALEIIINAMFDVEQKRLDELHQQRFAGLE
jgi:hypothetical protein